MVTAHKNHLSSFGIFLGLALSVTGCTSVSGWHTQKAPDDFVEGTRVLGEVIMVPTREQIDSLKGGLFSGLKDKMLLAGHTDKDLVKGSVVTVWSYCFGHNSVVPLCRHHGHYIAYVPPDLRESLHPNEDGNPETFGDLVETELSRLPSGDLVGTVVGVYRKSADWGSCHQARLEGVSALLSSLYVGPPRALWLECEDAQSDGWDRRPVSGAPYFKGPPVSEWIKIP
jgi:hypothetical protein